MISLKRYLSANNSEEATLRQIISLLVARIASSAVEGVPAECAAFRADIRQIGNAVASDIPADSLMVLAGEAAQALAVYNKKIESSLTGRENEVNHILGMLRDTVIQIAGENTRSVKRLQEITTELEQNVAVADLRVLKGRLIECLKGLREETKQQQAEVAMTVQKLQMTIERGRPEPAAKIAHRQDPMSGLPDRAEALVAMQGAIDGGSRSYAVIMVVSRVKMISNRFGRDVGDRMLAGFREYLQTQLSGTDQLFRWGEPAILAILERPVTIESVRVQLKRMLDAKIEVTYVGDGRSVLIPVAAAWLALPLITSVTAQRQIEAFIAAQTAGD